MAAKYKLAGKVSNEAYKKLRAYVDVNKAMCSRGLTHVSIFDQVYTRSN